LRLQPCWTDLQAYQSRCSREKAATPAQIALARLLRQPAVLSRPKPASAADVRDNRAAADLSFDDNHVAALDRAFPKPAAASDKGEAARPTAACPAPD
jgi:aryl-alcohol dehydrogenase-like predicted oxidoreductase